MLHFAEADLQEDVRHGMWQAAGTPGGLNLLTHNSTVAALLAACTLLSTHLERPSVREPPGPARCRLGLGRGINAAPVLAAAAALRGARHGGSGTCGRTGGRLHPATCGVASAPAPAARTARAHGVQWQHNGTGWEGSNAGGSSVLHLPARGGCLKRGVARPTAHGCLKRGVHGPQRPLAQFRVHTSHRQESTRQRERGGRTCFCWGAASGRLLASNGCAHLRTAFRRKQRASAGRKCRREFQCEGEMCVCA